ncbi:MAG: insulinase family protein [Bacteroidetes bacterium]|nr:insulinase family protein [Bacteroidota bacterium]
MPSLNRMVAPEITDPIDFDLTLQPYQSYTLDNNVPVYSIHAGTQEVVQVEWVFDAGNWQEEKKLVAAATNFMLKNGTSQLNAFSINQKFEFYGAFLSVQCHIETASITLFCLHKYAALLIPVVAEILTNSIFPEDELKTFRQIQIQKLKVNLEKCDFVANRMIDAYLYGENHPYGSMSGLDAYEALIREDLQTFFHRYYLNGHCQIFVSGIIPKSMDHLLNHSFGQLPLNQQELPKKEHFKKAEKEKKHRIIQDEKGVQAAIRMARSFPNKHHPDFPKATVLNNILGGFFGSRLMANIREEKGYTYGIYSYFKNYFAESEWLISTEAGREVSEATIIEIHKELEKLKQEPVGEDELYLVRNQLMGSLLSRLDGPFEIMSRWKNYILNGLDIQYFNQSIEVIKTISSQELQELANKYFSGDPFYELTVI